MKEKRKQELTEFALWVAKENYTEDELTEKTVAMRLSFEEFIIVDDLVQKFMDKIKKGEIKNER